MNIIDVLAVLPYYVEQGMANMETRARENIQADRVLQSVMMDNVTYRSILYSDIRGEGSCNELTEFTDLLLSIILSCFNVQFSDAGP